MFLFLQVQGEVSKEYVLSGKCFSDVVVATEQVSGNQFIKCTSKFDIFVLKVTHDLYS